MSAADKVWGVFSLGEVVIAEGEPHINSDGHLEFMREDGQVTACFCVWSAYRLQDKP